MKASLSSNDSMAEERHADAKYSSNSSRLFAMCQATQGRDAKVCMLSLAMFQEDLRQQRLCFHAVSCAPNCIEPAICCCNHGNQAQPSLALASMQLAAAEGSL